LAGRVLLPAVMVAGLVAERFGRIEREGRGGGSFDSLRMTDLWAWDERAVRASRECPTHAMKLAWMGHPAPRGFCFLHLKGEMWGTAPGEGVFVADPLIAIRPR